MHALKKYQTSNIPSSELNVKEVAEARRLIDIARNRGITMSEILQYELLTNNSLFERKSPSKREKQQIVTKLENILEIKNGSENLDDTSSSFPLCSSFFALSLTPAKMSSFSSLHITDV